MVWRGKEGEGGGGKVVDGPEGKGKGRERGLERLWLVRRGRVGWAGGYRHCRCSGDGKGKIKFEAVGASRWVYGKR